MQRDLRGLADSTFDLVVIGGGVFGAAAAWDATQRGLSVALIERADFASYTSANSFKVVHGGIRYLQHADLYRIRQSSGERRAFLNIAPHLVKPLPIAVPTYGWGMKGKPAMRFGVGIYDLLTADRNCCIPDPKRAIPNAYGLSRSDTLDLFPGLITDGLTGSVVFNDGQMQNPPRLVLAFVQSAARAGAVVANYVEATGLIKQGDAITGVEARDVLTGADFPIRAKMVLNAAGPYAEGLLERALSQKPGGQMSYSRDACFVVNRRLFDHDIALAAQAQTHDPDALVSRGNRHLFVASWRSYTLIGTWHVVWKKDPAAITVEDAELEAFLAEAKEGFPGLDVDLDDVGIWNCGLVPFGENDEGAANLRYGHRSSLIDHQKTDGLDNLLTLIGVRFTTGRFEAEQAVDIVAKRLGHRRASRTATTPLVGGDFERFDDELARTRKAHGDRLPEDAMRSLLHHYGTGLDDVLGGSADRPDLLAPIGDSAVIGAQAVHAVRNEMAQTLGDIVFRRTDLATGAYPGEASLRAIADVVGPMLGWSEATTQAEIDQIKARFPKRAVRATDRAHARDIAAA
ncbi:MAG: glycerol-3-phosphate dehydrogenase/oxidase [Alphaproteobacteria bacterium]|nr:glycerol-3-phosphate dehydrogenase/oxidase [Alphaproteobacteria bacterium]